MFRFFYPLGTPVLLNFAWIILVCTIPKNFDALKKNEMVVSSQSDFETVLSQSQALYATIDQFAWEPVTKQQLYTEVARAFYTTQNLRAPRELHRAASQITDDETFGIFLAETWVAAGLENTEMARGEGYADLICQKVVERLLPGASFVTPKQSRVNKQLAENQYVGIGIRVRFNEGRAIIDEPFPGGAARQAGSVSGDCILEVDGQSMDGLSLGQIVEILRGPENSAVKVVVQNLDGSPRRTLDMVRTVVPIASVHGVLQSDDGSWQFAMEENPQIGYLKINQVVGSTSVELTQAARVLVDQGIEKVILDLRELYDGDLHQVHMLADVLCPQGNFGTLESSNGERRELKTNQESAFAGLQVAVLAPQQMVFGPVLSLLSMLKNRPNTQVIGPQVSGSVACRSTFDFANQKGTLSDMVYAQLIPAEFVSTQQKNAWPKQLLFSPNLIETSPKTPQKLALAWLK